MGGARVLVESGALEPLTVPVNRFLVSIGGERFYVDAGVTPPSGDARVFLVTHWHWDHVYGLKWVDSPVVCADESVFEVLLDQSVVAERLESTAKILGVEPDSRVLRLLKARYREVTAATAKARLYGLKECPVIDGEVVKALSCRGHSGTDACYIVGGYAFLGDNYVTVAPSTVVRDIRSFIDGVLRVLSEASWSTACPGHGQCTERSVFAGWVSSVLWRKIGRIAHISAMLGASRALSTASLASGSRGLEAILEASNMAGYLEALEALGVARVRRDSAPWTLESRLGDR